MPVESDAAPHRQSSIVEKRRTAKDRERPAEPRRQVPAARLRRSPRAPSPMFAHLLAVAIPQVATDVRPEKRRRRVLPFGAKRLGRVTILRDEQGTVDEVVGVL